MEESIEEPVGFVARVCAIDIGKAGLVVCVRVPHEKNPARRVQEVREYVTTTPSLLSLAQWLHDLRIELVAMEATSDYWKPVFYLLEAEGFECWLLNAKHVKNVPGRPKTDLLTELRRQRIGSVRHEPDRASTVSGRGRRRRRGTRSVPLEGCHGRLAAAHWGSVRAVPAR
jgi:transposase